MIAWGDIYNVVSGMAPLYFALVLGYGSVRWWRLFTAAQCGAINTLVANFSMPFFTLDFLARADPYAMNYRVLAADAVSKALLAVAAGGGAGSRSSSWAITGFSLAGFNNTLVVGVPLLFAMYGKWAQDLVVQVAVVQALVWFPLLLLGFELRRAWVGGVPRAQGVGVGVGRCSSDDDDGDGHLGGRVGPVSLPPPLKTKDVEMNAAEEEAADDDAPAAAGAIRLWPTVRTVGLKLVGNPMSTPAWSAWCGRASPTGGTSACRAS
uniref:Putative truncated auxin efflux carrier PIN5b n=1 Tax=Zea mays TaxID=4577 RepID=I3RWV6_MAIZE|nr:putative truncated auxin efflux carrier PIN5b [Zea mays]